MADLPAQQDSTPGILGRYPVLWWALVVMIFGVGLAVRVYDITDAPLDFHPTRQLHSALIARGMYYQNLASVPDWQREMAVTQLHAEGEIEPQVFERLVASTYALAGSASLWIPRLYSILFWTLGGLALLWLARELVGNDGAVVALLFYMAWPYGVFASRSFQPEPLLVALILWSLWALLHWDRRPTWLWTVVTGLLAGLAIYIKLVAVFFIGPAFALFLLFRQGFKTSFRSPKVWVLALLALVPYAIYHADGMYIRKFLVSQLSLRFFPQYWVDPAWYLRWIGEATRVVSLELLLIALVGTFLIQRKDFRAMLLAMWLGYFIYGFTLAHHISTHDYYHILLYPMLAVGLAAAARGMLRGLRGPLWMTTALVVGVLLFGLSMKAWEARSTLKRTDYRAEVLFWQDLGKELESGSVVGLVQDYGFRLNYWGWVNPTNWMVSDDFKLRETTGQTFDPQALFDEVTAGKSFFLVTLMDELDRQPVLKEILERGYPVYKQGDGYIIYDLRSPITPQPDPAAP